MNHQFIESTATFSPCREFRYTLYRRWGDGPTVSFVGLNPSTADESQPDPTVTRCITRSKALGFGSMFMLNLFAFRSTDRTVLVKRHRKEGLPIIGPGNDEAIATTASKSDMVICCWGADGTLAGRDAQVLDGVLSDRDLYCLRVTRGGQPEHPLYLPYTLTPILYRASKVAT